MSTFSASNQFIRLSYGKRALYDAYDFSLHHPDTNQFASGIFSQSDEKWFSSGFTYHMYMYDNNLGPYADPRYRSQVKETMEKTAERCCPKDMINFRKEKYHIYS